MKCNSTTIASMILAIFMVIAVLLINDPAPSSDHSAELSEQIINRGANFCRACP